jgi:uncharacterized protein (TIGR02270 family)
MSPCPVIPDVLAEHLEQLAMLWEQRQDALRSPDLSGEDVFQIDKRLEAHVDGLLLAGDQVLPLLEQALASGESSSMFAAVYVLLRQESQASADRVIDVLMEAQEGPPAEVRQALCHGPIKLIERRLRDLAVSGPAAVAVVAFEALAYHERAMGLFDRLAEFYTDENPAVRQAAWRITAMLPESEV